MASGASASTALAPPQVNASRVHDAGIFRYVEYELDDVTQYFRQNGFPEPRLQRAAPRAVSAQPRLLLDLPGPAPTGAVLFAGSSSDSTGAGWDAEEK